MVMRMYSILSSAGGEDDFEMFLASVKARSISTRAKQRRGKLYFSFSKYFLTFQLFVFSAEVNI